MDSFFQTESLQIERDMRNGDSTGDYTHSVGEFPVDYGCSKIVDRDDGYGAKSPSMSLPIASPSKPLSWSSASVTSPGAGFIEHRVSKLDTLAGVAIKYGVEVADIKKMNGLVTDLQMFALKSLKIPLPGRHPPSPCLSNGHSTPGHRTSEISSAKRVQCDLLDSFQSLRLKSPPCKVSAAMSSLQGFYGLKPANQNEPSQSFEMAVYKKGTNSHHLEDQGSYITPPLSHNRKSKSLANSLFNGNGDLSGDIFATESGEGNSDKSNEKLVRRRQKSETDFTSRTQELLLEDNTNGGGFSAITGKGLALRSKAASRTNLAPESETADSVASDGSYGVRKSSSASSLQDQDNNNYSSSSIWPTPKWSLKPDLQALSTAGITRPIFDGLPKPLSGRKNKAALD